MAKAKKGPAARPLSPHLQIYRWPITMGTSILHRVTGVGLALGTVLLAAWMAAAAAGPETFAQFQTYAGHAFGRLVLFGFTVSLVYHALNGVRHLAWDLGWGFHVPTANKTGLLVYALTGILTLGVWAAAYWVKGDLSL